MIDFSNINVENKNVLSSQSQKEYKQMGRKPKKEEDKKTEKICIYLTKTEKEIITKKSYENYMDISAYCKNKLLAE